MIHSEVTARTFGFIRAYVFGLWLIKVLYTPLHDMTAVPLEAFRLDGLLWLIPQPLWELIWSPGVFLGMQIITVAVLVLAMVGAPRYHVFAITAVVLLTYREAFMRGVGFVNHKELVPLFAAYMLAIFPAVDAFAWRRRGKSAAEVSTPAAINTYSMGVNVIVLLYIAGYTTIAIHRLARSAPEIFLSDTMMFHIAEGSLLPYPAYGLRLGTLALDFPLLGFIINLGFAVTTIFEVLTPLCLFSRWFRYLWLLVIVSFHIMTLLMMNIFFWEVLLLMPIAFLDVNAWFTRLSGVRFARAPQQASSGT